VAAPDFVPTDPTEQVRRYHSPPRRPDSWWAQRPADLLVGQPAGDLLGNIGPDQGYALKLARQFEGKLHLGRVAHDDAVSGCLAVAMKRSSLFGRAPVIHDLTAAFTIFGFLDPNPPADLVAWREPLFAEVRSSHHYAERRAIADLVPAEVLRQPHGTIADTYRQAWRTNLTLQP
jgi:hypothetical protein